MEEAVFVAYGIIIEKELPPVTLERYALPSFQVSFLKLFPQFFVSSLPTYALLVTKFRQFMGNKASRARYATVIRQYVAITGLNLEAFQKTLEGQEKIHAFFQDSLPNQTLQPTSSISFHKNLAMACYTRYFQSTTLYRPLFPHPFGPGVDPNGDLSRLCGDTYMHTEDNVVQYLSRKFDDGVARYISFLFLFSLKLKNFGHLKFTYSLTHLLTIFFFFFNFFWAGISTSIQRVFKRGISWKYLSRFLAFELDWVT